jgi:hypothetical protein
MAIPQALIQRVSLHATADDANDALRVLHAAEAVLRRAVEASAAALGGEVLVFRRVNLDIAVDLDGEHPIEEAQLESALRGAVVRPIARARAAPASGPVITEEYAWFPDEAAALAELLAAHAGGRASQWPFDLMTLWGDTPADLLRGCLERDRSLLADVLAVAVRQMGGQSLLALVTEELAEAVVAAFGASAQDGAIAGAALPEEVRRAISAEAAELHGHTRAKRDLGALARLFALWPPARVRRVPVAELRLLASEEPAADERSLSRVLEELLDAAAARALVDRLTAEAIAALVAVLRGGRDPRSLAAVWAQLEASGIDVAALREAVEGISLRRIPSAAGGLIAWAALFDAEGLWSAIDDAYPASRTQRAVRWAVGCALEDARIGGIDPTLALWCGEDPGAPIDAWSALQEADAEPLHACAIRFAARRRVLSGALEIARFGDFVTLTGDTVFCLDAVLGEDVHRAVPELVRRLMRRSGSPPPAICVADRMSLPALDALADVDVPTLTEAWRAAVRAFASAARAAVAERWRVALADLRRWPAVVELGRDHEATVEILASDAKRVAGAGWLRDGVAMGAKRICVRLK